MLVAIPGIGKKLAERIIFELKEKVAAAGVSRRRPVGRRVGAAARARSSPRSRRSATRWRRRARRRGWRWPTSASSRRSRNGSRPRCAACCATDPPGAVPSGSASGPRWTDFARCSCRSDSRSLLAGVPESLELGRRGGVAADGAPGGASRAPRSGSRTGPSRWPAGTGRAAAGGTGRRRTVQAARRSR